MEEQTIPFPWINLDRPRPPATAVRLMPPVGEDRIDSQPNDVALVEANDIVDALPTAPQPEAELEESNEVVSIPPQLFEEEEETQEEEEEENTDEVLVTSMTTTSLLTTSNTSTTTTAPEPTEPDITEETALTMPASISGEDGGEDNEEKDDDEKVVTCATTLPSISSNTSTISPTPPTRTPTPTPTPTTTTRTAVPTAVPTPENTSDETEEERNDVQVVPEQANAPVAPPLRRSRRIAAALANAQRINQPLRRSARLAGQPRVNYQRFFRLRG